jgi:Tfp pilus assembly protein PilX
MFAGLIVLIIVVVILLVVIGGTALRTMRRHRRLSERFGPEYDRVVSEHQSRRLAEAELSSRERRVQEFTLRELSDEDRKRYSTRWDNSRAQQLAALRLPCQLCTGRTPRSSGSAQRVMSLLAPGRRG